MFIVKVQIQEVEMEREILQAATWQHMKDPIL